MDRHPSDQTPEGGYWGPPLFAHHTEEDPYTGSATAPTNSSSPELSHHHGHHHHHPQRYSPWFQQSGVSPSAGSASQVSWIGEPGGAEGLYSPHHTLPGSRGSGEGSSSHRPGASPAMDPSSPNLLSSEQDEYGRFVCKYPECDAKPEDRIFTRKSDWRRHSDKHTRPYRCPYPACKDLAGFGWVGGLNRHLEELHNSKAQHKCPYTDCKRHANGFSRSANLKNHMRKVHNAESDYAGSGSGATQSDAGDHSGAEMELESPPPPPPLLQAQKKPHGGAGSQQHQRRQQLRTRDQILLEISEAENELVRRDAELRDAQQRKADVVANLERLQAELGDRRFPPSSSSSTAYRAAAAAAAGTTGEPCVSAAVAAAAAAAAAGDMYFSPAPPAAAAGPSSSSVAIREGDDEAVGPYDDVESYRSSPSTPPLSEPAFSYHPHHPHRPHHPHHSQRAQHSQQQQQQQQQQQPQHQGSHGEWISSPSPSSSSSWPYRY